MAASALQQGATSAVLTLGDLFKALMVSKGTVSGSISLDSRPILPSPPCLEVNGLLGTVNGTLTYTVNTTGTRTVTVNAGGVINKGGFAHTGTTFVNNGGTINA